MTSASYWVELFQSEQRLGGGFLLTRRYVVTALHCLRGLTSLDEHVDIILADGSRLGGQVCRREKDADLALIMISAECEVLLPIPQAGVAHGGDDWHSPYRPAASEVHLRGQVDSGTAEYLCEGGAVIQALQLTAHQHLGDYSGYSGGPVVKGVPEEHEPVIVGILLEQAPDRAAADRSANVLFAATIGEAMRRFDQFDVGHLMDVLHPATSMPQQTANTEKLAVDSAAAAAESWFGLIDEWAKRRVLDPSQVAELKFMAAKAVMKRQLRGDGA
ncbi:trypsin-like peptidase domain-containing protein [Streptomyces sp. NPDC001815]|uniref:trypsin-like peptidase domain-containing protein n=1 Tax=Streptomyces sp. NPDC001815 TaxID=3154526 RepID=UPI003331C3E8